MELDASIEPTIGPYETYEDEWFGYKAAFEAFITLRDDAETKKLGDVQRRAAGARERAADRPEVPQRRSSARSRPSASSTSSSAAGDGNRGVQTAAFNLPNDDRVISEKGSKRVMLKNVQEAKFAEGAHADRRRRAARPPIARTCRSTRSSRTS